MKKKRILIVNEASFVSSGFGVYGHEVLNRLYDTGKYELAELACYGRVNDPKDRNTRWRYYANAVAPEDKRHGEYQSNGANAFGQWRFDRTLLDFKPDIVCTPPGELVLTKKGYVPIEDIKIGDYVMTHRGRFRKVLRTMRREHNGKLYYAYYKGCKHPLKLTAEHPVYVHKKRRQTNQKKSFKKIYDGIEPEFIDIQHLREGDLIVLPQPKQPDQHIWIDICIDGHLTNFFYNPNDDKIYPSNRPSGIGIPRNITINKDFGTLVGYIIGDGCVQKSHINIFFNSKEMHFAEDACRIFKQCFDIKCKITLAKEKNMLTVSTCSVLLSEFFTKFNPAKHVFDNIPYAQGVIRGLVRSDGCYKKNTVSFCSTNKDIAYLYHMICLFLNIPTNIQYKRRNNPKHKNAYEVEGYGDSAKALHKIAHKYDKIECPDNSKKSCRTTQIINSTLISTIRRIRTIDYHGQVYNLEVEDDNSYIIQGACVHNCSIRDPWMDMYIRFSPYRPYFYWAHMPTCDSSPQQTSWMETFINADCLLAWNDWSLETLRKESGNTAKIYKSAPSCANPNHFYPIKDKKKNRLEFGLQDDINLVGTVMRNQKRKLYPELFQAFNIFLQKCINNGNEKLAKKTYLYCHTSYPDMGFDIPGLIKQHGLGNKVLFTYICRVCNGVFPSFFRDAITICPYCNSITAVLPSVAIGVSSEQLGKIMNCFDYYIQYAICLGKDEEIRIRRDGVEQWMPISQTKVGDEAWTHKNRWRPITKVWKNLPKSHDKKVLKLSIHSDYETLLATENHEFPAYTANEIKPHKSQSVRERFGDNIRHKRPILQPRKYQLSQLKPGDLLLYPIDDTIEDVEKIDFANTCDDEYLVLESLIEVPDGNVYPRYVEVDYNFCRFIGLFAADGSWQYRQSVKGIKITSHQNEIQNQYIAVQTMRRMSIDNVASVRVYPNRQGQDNALWSKLHADVFRKWFKKHEEKQLPEWCLYLPTIKQKCILQGLFLGDGCFVEDRNTSIYTTISKTLADQLKHILRRSRIQFNCHIDYKRGNRKPQYRFEIPGDVARWEFVQKRNSSHGLYYENNHIVKIKSIEKTDYNDDVWCITVDEDHTMTTKTCTNFQCEGFGMPAVEAAACGVPIAEVDYSAMEDVVRKLGGDPIKIGYKFREMETGADRVYPDNKHCADLIYDYLILPEDKKKERIQRTLDGIEEHYTWDKTTKVWEDVFDNAELTGRQGKWDAPLIHNNPPNQIPEGLNNEQYVEWLYTNVVFEPEEANGFNALSILRELNYRFKIEGRKISPVNRQQYFERFLQIQKNKNMCELARCGQVPIVPHDFIEYAKLKAELGG